MLVKHFSSVNKLILKVEESEDVLVYTKHSSSCEKLSTSIADKKFIGILIRPEHDRLIKPKTKKSVSAKCA